MSAGPASTRRASSRPFRRELEHMREMAPGRTVSSIFFGGGTPSLMKPETVGGILEAIGQNWTIRAGLRNLA